MQPAMYRPPLPSVEIGRGGGVCTQATGVCGDERNTSSHFFSDITLYEGFFFYCCILFQVFTTYTLTVFKCLNQVETMYQTPPLNVQVEPRSTFKVLRLRATSHSPSLISRETGTIRNKLKQITVIKTFSRYLHVPQVYKNYTSKNPK